jgi:hypothetical protein
MRLVLATKREVTMSDRKLLFLMDAGQAEMIARLLSSAQRLGEFDGEHEEEGC